MTDAAFRRGDSGIDVAVIRTRLAALGLLVEPLVDGAGAVYDDAVETAVRHFQQERGLSADGVCGPQTLRVLDEARWRLGDRLLSFVPASQLTGDDVLALQQRLSQLGFDTGRPDGSFGVQTDAALRDFQRNVGLPPDGTCGPSTFKALARLAPIVTGGHQVGLREHEVIRSAGPRLHGKVIVIDPGHGGVDRGVSGYGSDEAAIVEDLAARVEGRLTATGVRAYLTRGPGSSVAPDDSARAAFANEAGADLVVSLHVDGAPDDQANGVCTYYYGNDAKGASSKLGERFAGLVQREIVARTDLLDCRTLPKTWDLLRYTRMPAIRIELGYLTNLKDAARLLDPQFRDVVAEAIVVAIQRVYLPAEDDSPTGALRLKDLTH